MQAVYILTTPGHPDGYKIGVHKGDIKKLRSRYITALPNLVIHFFYPHNNAAIIEAAIHRENRHLGPSGEWYKISLFQAINLVMSYIVPDEPCTTSAELLEIAEYGPHACAIMATRGNLDKLQAFKAAGANWDINAVAVAAITSGHLDCLKFVESTGKLSDFVLAIAFKHNHECFMHLLKNGWSAKQLSNLLFTDVPENAQALYEYQTKNK